MLWLGIVLTVIGAILVGVIVGIIVIFYRCKTFIDPDFMLYIEEKPEEKKNIQTK